MRRGHIKLGGINALRTNKGGRLQAGISSDGPRLSSALDHEVVIVQVSGRAAPQTVQAAQGSLDAPRPMAGLRRGPHRRSPLGQQPS